MFVGQDSALGADGLSGRLDLVQVFAALAAAFPGRDCTAFRGAARTWVEVEQRVRALATLLENLGVGGDVREGTAPWVSPHDHVALYLHNGPEYLESVIAAHAVRAAPFNVNYRYVSKELDYVLGHGRPRAVIFHARFAPQVSMAVSDRHVVLVQVADDSGHALLPGAVDYEHALAEVAPLPNLRRGSPEDLHILFTGGTTGQPKGVLWRQCDLIAGPLGASDEQGRSLSLSEVLSRAHNDPPRVLPTSPLMHGAGLWFALKAWLSGGLVVFPDVVDRFDAHAVLRAASKYEATAMSVVGDAMALPILELLETGAFDALRHLRTVLNTAAPMREELKCRFESLVPSARVLDALGASETGRQATRNTGEVAFTPQPNTVVLDEGMARVMAPGEKQLGWSATTGPTALGYLGDSEKTSETFRVVAGQRFAVPGDRARLHRNGRIEFLGRDSQTINTGGEKVFAEEVELALRSQQGVDDALVVGRSSGRWGTEVVAVIQVARGFQFDVAELRDQLAEALARYKIPKSFVVVPSVRRHANGKPDYAWAHAVASGDAP